MEDEPRQTRLFDDVIHRVPLRRNGFESVFYLIQLVFGLFLELSFAHRRVVIAGGRAKIHRMLARKQPDLRGVVIDIRDEPRLDAVLVEIGGVRKERVERELTGLAEAEDHHAVFPAVAYKIGDGQSVCGERVLAVRLCARDRLFEQFCPALDQRPDRKFRLAERIQRAIFLNDFCAFFTKQFAFCPFDLDAVARLCGLFVKLAIKFRRKRAVQPVRVDIRADEVVLDDVIHPALVRLVVDLARDHEVE